MEINFSDLLSKTGLSITDVMDKLPKILAFVPKAKSYIPMTKELEKVFKIQKGEKLIYSLMPICPTYTGTETPDEKDKLDAMCEIKISVLVIRLNEKNETVIDREAVSFNAFQEIEKISSLFPKM